MISIRFPRLDRREVGVFEDVLIDDFSNFGREGEERRSTFDDVANVMVVMRKSADSSEAVL